MVSVPSVGARRVLLSAATFVLASSLSACSGGTPASSALPAAKAATAAPAASGKLAQTTITVTVPSRVLSSVKRKPQFVSPSAQSITINAYAVVSNVISGSIATTTTQNLTSATPGCSSTSGGMACAVTMMVPAGVAAFEISVYQGLNATGSLLSYTPQSTATEATIVEGVSNVILPLVLGGVVANAVLSTSGTAFAENVSASYTIRALAYDAGGNLIVGGSNYATPLTLTNSDASGATSFSVPTIDAPGGTATINFNGTAFPPPSSVSITSGSATANTLSYTDTGSALTVACVSTCAGLANGPSPYTLTVSEAGYGSNVFTFTYSGAQCNVDPGTSVTASGGSASINVYPSPNGGTCAVTVSDLFTTSSSGTMSFVAAGTPTVIGIGGYTFPVPADPNSGGTLRIYSAGAGAIQYGAYIWLPLQSNTNPSTYQVAGYANPNAQPVTQFTVGGNRYIVALSISSPNVVVNGQSGNTNLPFTSLVPP